MSAGATRAQEAVSGSGLAKSGSILAVSILVANAGNYLLNIFLARWLTPAEFSDANLMVTLMLSATSLATCLQLVAARYIGVFNTAGDSGKAERLAAQLRKYAVLLGTALAIILGLGSPLWSAIFNTESWMPFAILGVGMPFYLAQSVSRGVLQGQLAFSRLAVTFIVEMLVRLGVSLGLVAAGLGVDGATVGLSASFVMTWLIVRVLLPGRAPSIELSSKDTREIRLYAGSVAVLLIGQIVANNVDVFVSKAVLEPADAGIYSAIALVGRAVFFLAWSVATVIFPVAAASGESGGKDHLLRGAVAVVSLLGAACVAGSYVVGGPVISIVLGPEYSSLETPLAAYAAVTTLFAVANLVATHKLSKGSTAPARYLLFGAAAQSVILVCWNDSILSLIEAKAVGTAITLLAVCVAAAHSKRRSVAAQFEGSQP